MSKWKEINKPRREHEIRSGTVVRVQTMEGQPPTDILVGEVNDMGGSCDCCTWICKDNIILAELDLNDMIEAAKAVG